MRRTSMLAPVFAATLLMAGAASAQDAPSAEMPPADPGATTEGQDGATADASTGDATETASDAPSGDYPMRYALRPMTLPPMMLSPELGFSVNRLNLGPASATIMNLRVGAEFGVIENLTVDATPLAFSFGDASGYGIATLGGTYRFYDGGDIEVGGRLRLGFTDGPDVVVNAGVPVRVHMEDFLRIDTGAYFNLLVPNGGDAAPGLATVSNTVFVLGPGIPVEASVSITDMIYAGLNTGFGIADFANAGDTIFVPLGFQVGGTIPVDEQPIADVSAGFGFPYFVNSLGGDAISADFWALSINAKGYFQL